MQPRPTRPALWLALAGLAASGSIAFAADAPRTTATSKTLFLSQDGCGSTAGPGRLETTPHSDSADGCGTIGGAPLQEVFAQDQADFGPLGDDYVSTKKLVPFLLDASRKVTGQLAAASWFGGGVGVGTVTFDVHLVATSTTGRRVDFGSTTVSGDVTPGQDPVEVPFQLAVPRSAAGTTVMSFTLTVTQRGRNVGMSSKQLSGESYVVIPAKTPPPVRRR
ncbi:MAG: hypothetical protein WCD35_13380 [Mycobacteriales bacterium]